MAAVSRAPLERGRSRAGVFAALVVLLAATGWAATPAPAAATCHLSGSGGMVAPQRSCTPGDRRRGLTRHKACTASEHPREPVSAGLRRDVIERYGLDPDNFHGEVDHRVPVFLLGRSTLANLWPEAGSIPNPKDRLEFYVYRRVCFADPQPMRPSTGVRIFTGDWRTAYRRYFGGGA